MLVFFFMLQSKYLFHQLKLRPERDVVEETEKCWEFSRLQNEIDCLKLKRQGVREPDEQIHALARELDILHRLHKLATDLDIFTFQFILNNILDDGFNTASRVFKLHLKLSNQSLPASAVSSSISNSNLRAAIQPDAFSNQKQSRAKEEVESQESFLQTATTTTTTTSSTTAAAATTPTTPVPTAGDFWLLQLRWFAEEGARFVFCKMHQRYPV